MIETASKAGPRLAFDDCLIVPHFVPGVLAPRLAGLKEGVGEAVGSEEAVTVTTASEDDEAEEDGEGSLVDAVAEERILGQNVSPNCCTSFLYLVC